MGNVLAFGLVAFALSTALTQFCKEVGRRLGLVARPRADRWHLKPVPLLGGVAVASTVWLAAPFAITWNESVAAFFAGTAILFGLGLLDDFRSLRPQTKLIVQILVAVGLASIGVQFRLTPYPTANVLLTLVWVVGITNAFNLLDNMDGLAAGIAAITAGFRLGFFVMDGNLEGARLAAVFVGATVGFLVHNFSPASIFMGDAGSLFIGFFVAGLSLIGGYPYSRSVISVVLFPVLILLVPIFDTTFVTISRSLARRPISVGGRDHTSHRLVALGFSARRAVSSLYLVALVSGTVAYLSYRFGLSYGIVLIVFLALAVMILGLYLSQIRVYQEEDTAALEGGKVFRLIVALTYKRQLATLAVDVALIVLAYYTAYLLRFEEAFHEYDKLIVQSLPVVIACQVFVFGLFKIHYGVWRYTGLEDLIRVVEAATVGAAMSVVAVVLLYRFEGYSWAVFALDWMLLVVFVVGSRVSLRVLGERLHRSPQGLRRVLIYGAGDGGMLVCREVRNNRALGRTLVGFIDDDPRKQGRRIQGVPILGGRDQLPEIIKTYQIEEVLVASHKISGDNLRMLSMVCEDLGVDVFHASLRLA